MTFAGATISRLSSSNDAPTVEEALFVREALEDMELKIAEHERQLQELQRKLSEYRPILAPCRRLPPEILGEIFTRLLDITDDSNCSQPTLAWLCRVCKNWRDAAYLCPRFWSHVTLNPSKTRQPWHHSVGAWLRRARNLPKSLLIMSYSCAPTYSANAHRHRHLKLCRGEGQCPFSSPDIMKMLPSLTNLSISCPTPNCLQQLQKNTAALECLAVAGVTLLTIWADDWDYLASTTVNLFPFHSPSAFISISNLTLHLPNLHNLEPPDEDVDVDFTLPFDLLQRLEAFNLRCNWPADNILKMLQHCESLKVLTIDFDNGNFNDWVWNTRMEPFRDNPVLLRNLRTFHLSDFPTEALVDLRFFQLHSIENLSILMSRDERWNPSDDWYDMSVEGSRASTFATFLRGDLSSESTLKSLSIMNGYFKEDSLLNALRGLSSLEHLTLDCALFDVKLFERTAASGLLPRLKDLTLLQLHVPLDDIVGLETFVKNRGIELTTSQYES